MMKRGIVFIYLLVFVIQNTLNAQPPAKFATTFGGSGVDIGHSLLQLPQGSYVYVGSSSSYESQSSDILLSKIDSMGNLIWKKYYGGAGLDIGKKVLLNPLDSGYFIAGYSNSQVNTGYDGYCVRTDKAGNVKWQKNYGGSDWDFFNDICLSPTGDLYACGSSYSNSNGLTDGFVCKIDTSNGNLKWQKTIGGAKSESLEKIVFGSNGTIYVAGNKTVNDFGTNKFWLLRLNSNGDTVSTKILGHSYGSDRCYDMIEDKKQNLLLCGSFDTSFVANGKKNVSYALTTDLNGNVITQFTLGAAGPDDHFNAVAIRKRTNDYFFSRSVLYGIQQINVQPILFMDDFTYLGSTTYGGFEIDEAYSVIETRDNGFAMIGYTKSYTEAKDENVYFIKLDSTLLNVQIIAGLSERILNKGAIPFSYNKGSITINDDQAMYPYSISSLTGQTMQSGNFENGQVVISQSIPAGLYMIRYYKDAWYSHKFVIRGSDE